MAYYAIVTAIVAFICSVAAHADGSGMDTKQFAGWSQEELNEKWGMDVRFHAQLLHT